ncbi:MULTISPECIES: hypothetical protein [unclassified Kocuria]|uniref:hypothetical protein n=1 Tax=unclassified Kocuria TaxID=2649579 RepID=UPI00064AA1EB|nr:MULTISPECIES: hypothetical protein [unclassified Kocuria]KLU10248.1 hypothetical protein ABL57_07440 [Kocuria sp. SM24M-10]OLT07205.1 hypothetical protein BJF77_02695 [Kocuria sp. CNJ-770]
MGTHSTRTTRTLAAGLFAVAGLGLAGCGSEGPETGTDVEDVTDGEVVESSAAATEDAGAMALAYEGDYNQDFYDEVTTYTGQQVTLSAEVSETISPDAFAIAGAVDPLLIVEEQEIPPLDDGQVVQVTGTVQEGFDVAGVEQELGVDLEDEAFTEFEGEPYIMATSGEVIEQE